MRVLFVTGEFAPMQGGVGDYTREIARALVNCAIEAHVLTTDPGGAELETRDGLVIHRLVRRWDWGAIGILRRLIKQTRPDIVHLQYQTAAFGMHPAINLSPRLLALRSPGALELCDDLPRSEAPLPLSQGRPGARVDHV